MAASVTILYATVPSTIASSTPVTSTVCGVFQFDAVNVTDAGATVPSVVSSELSGIVTFAVGSVFRTTVKVAVPPASVVSPLMVETVIPAISLSVRLAVALSVTTFTPAVTSEIVAIMVSVPSTIESSVVSSMITAVEAPLAMEKLVSPVA